MDPRHTTAFTVHLRHLGLNGMARSHVPDLIEISIFKSAVFGDTIRSMIRQHPVRDDQPDFIHQLVSERKPVEYCRLLTRWKPMQRLATVPALLAPSLVWC